MDYQEGKRLYGGSTAEPARPKSDESDEISRQIAEFTARGGVIDECEIRIGEVEKKKPRGAHIRGKARSDFTINQTKKRARTYEKATASARRWNGSKYPTPAPPEKEEG